MIRHPDLDPLSPDELGRPRWNTTSKLVAENPELLIYVVEPNPLERVWAGDDPYTPTLTIALRFANEMEENSVLFNYRTTEAT